MPGSVSVYRKFAENLRDLCLSKGTIAVVCRDLGMNRQQFNKYLSGAALPNPVTLTKIAAYFGIDQMALFQSRESSRISLPENTDVGFAASLLEDTEIIKHLNITANQSRDVPLQDGCYHVYYPWLFDPECLVRAVLVVFRKGGMTYFRRYTRLQTAETAKLRHYARGCHEGIIFRHDRNICLLGRNSVGFGEISLQTYAFEYFSAENAVTGLSLVITPWGEYCALRATLSYFGPISAFRKALKLAKVGAVQKASVSNFITQSVTAPLSSRIPQMRAFNLDEWLRVAKVDP